MNTILNEIQVTEDFTKAKPLLCNIGTQVIEKAVDYDGDNTKRQRRGREQVIALLLEFQARGMKL